MPMLLGFVLVALFIWLAENLGTFANAWRYPSQADGWRPVGLAKLGSWYLLMLLSFVLVSTVHRPKGTSTDGVCPGSEGNCVVRDARLRPRSSP
jgi:uncharacterized membrane protein YoaT (DUF817 family)